MVATCTGCVNIKKSRVFPTHCVYAVYVILRINDYIFPKQYESVGLGNAVAMWDFERGTLVFKMQGFWYMMMCRLVYGYRLSLDYLEEGGSKLLRNVGDYLPLYTASCSWILESPVTLFLWGRNWTFVTEMNFMFQRINYYLRWRWWVRLSCCN